MLAGFYRRRQSAAGNIEALWDTYTSDCPAARGRSEVEPEVKRPESRTSVPVHAQCFSGGATRRPDEKGTNTVKPDIHPQYKVTEVTCSCGNTFTTRSTARNGVIHVETCNVCHP